ncbi:MAG TPA: hypothetical protein VHL50_02575 [Pyrinomonadaceae bacterium]|jgi:rubredoxin|nr:hypothetical protein [Pyrinomonadaceae bacterium]
MTELRDFYNDGFGWVCRQCESELSIPPDDAQHSRLMREGEGETRLSNRAMAKWADMLHETLVCPRCGITEKVDKS